MHHDCQFRHVGKEFVLQLTDLLRAGQSLALFGPRNAGKRYVLRKLREQARTFAAAVDSVAFLAAIPSERAALYEGRDDLELDESEQLEAAPEVVLQRLDDQLASTPPGKFVVLLAANADALPFEAGAAFSRGIADRMRSGQPLVVVLSGEVDLPMLLDEVDGGAWCPNRFALLGFERAEFAEVVRRYVAALGLKIAAGPEGVEEHLYRRTEGSVYLLRLLLYTAFERWSAMEGVKPTTLHLDQIADHSVAAQAPWSYYLRYVMRLIGQRTEEWCRLEAVVLGQHVDARKEGPDLLELSGLAVREGTQLRAGNSLLHAILHRYFTRQRFADMYTTVGMWDEALKRYMTIAPLERIRPTKLDDVADAAGAIEALSTSLYREATRQQAPAAAVRRRLVEGCIYLLGFPEVSFWVWENGDWKTSSFPEGKAEGDIGWYRQRLPLEDGVMSTVGILTPQRAIYGLGVLAALLPRRHGDIPEAVIVGGPQPQPPLSQSRHRLACKLMDDFLEAYAHALRTEQDHQRREEQTHYAVIINRIYAALGTEVRDVKEALEFVGAGLRRLGYRRLLICLRDPERQHLEAVWEDSDDPAKRLLHLTRIELTASRPSSVHGIVFKEGDFRRVPDFRAEPLARQDIVVGAGLTSGAIVPLRAGFDVIGTLFVERADGLVPTQEQAADLERFASRLAEVIDHSERTNLLLESLDLLREPVVLLDGRKRLRYANRRAASFLGVEPGWRRADLAVPLVLLPSPEKDSNLLENVHRAIQETWDENIPRIRHLAVRHEGKNHNAALLTANIVNRWGQRAGMLGNSRDLTYLYRMFGALRQLFRVQPDGAADRGQILQTVGSYTHKLILCVLEAVAAMPDHRAAFLYDRETGNGDQLRLCRSVGLPGSAETSRIPLTHREMGDLGWEQCHCLHMRTVVAFTHDPERPDGKSWTLPSGLGVVNVRRPIAHPLPRNPGEVWIDFPLLAGQQTLGKLTLNCEPEYDSEDFEFLRVLGDLCSGLLETAQGYDRRMQEWTGLIHENAQLLHDQLRHYIKGRTAELSHCLSDLRRFEEAALPAPGRPQMLWTKALTQFRQTQARIEKAADTIGVWALSIVPIKKRVDLADVVRQAIEVHFPSATVVQPLTSPPVDLDLDVAQFTSVLLNMLENSQQCFVPTSEKPALSISIRWTLQVNEEQPPSIRLLVEDNGPGIPEEDWPDVFDLSYHKRPKGTGFGLYLGRRIVHYHGGTISVVPGRRTGACFAIVLPLPPEEFSWRDLVSDHPT